MSIPVDPPSTEFVLVTGAPAAGGGFVAHDPTGRVVFVRHALPGERVRAVVTEEHATWARADAVEVLDASPQRVAAPCPHSGPGRCGGCDYQHVGLAAQRTLKAERLAEQLGELLDGMDPVKVEPVPGSSGLGTRTTVRYAVDDEGRLSMRRHGSHELIAVTSCPLGVARLDEITGSIGEWPVGGEVELTSLSSMEDPTVVVHDRPIGARRGRRRSWVQAGPGRSTGQRVVVSGHELSVSPGSFFQVHEAAPDLLVGAILEGLSLHGGERAADLYCGVGLFTVPIAAAVGPTGVVVGVDSSRSAIDDARRNLGPFPWASARAAKVDARIAGVLASSTHAVVDPPRRGLDRGALDALCRVDTLRRLVSVSCEPSTFARDLRGLRDGGWHTASIRAFDLFEMTEHLECVAILER
jgi:tRNA/tmRNA/rRNA uracil-C5-methylase (TrmA/RlmC/RlmD family)